MSSSAPPSLGALARESQTTYILALFVDLRGKPCAKLVPVAAVEQLAAEGAGFAGFAAGALGQEPKDPDLMAIPDPTSFTPIPFIKEGLALVHCDPHVNGKPWPYAPRVILKAMIERVASAGFEPFVGAEVEYFLVRRGDNGALTTADVNDTAQQPCYDAHGVTRMYDHLTAVSAAMNTLGWANYANDHEDGNGQFEQNFKYADALTTADRVVTLRYLIAALAEARGMIATFMPKPFTDRTGSGLHLHLSLSARGENVFPGAEDSRGLELSPLAYSFIGGILDHASALQCILAPTVNSYKRTGASSTASGATWSPKSATYGGNDRTHYIRVPDGNRIELRGGDGSANPYLAIAGALGAGLNGIERNVDPGDPGADSNRNPIPLTLLHAVDALEASDLVSGVLDVAAEDAGVARYFARIKREEFLAWHGTVGSWEIDHYLRAF